MEFISDRTGLLSVGTFLPLAGVLLMLFHPAPQRADASSRWRSGPRFATLGGRHLHAARVRLRPGREAPVLRDVEWIEVIRSNYTIGLDGISLPLYFLSMVITVLVMIYSWDHIPSRGTRRRSSS
jgi:NADH-quinone oxidoreductase subunit M